MFPSIIVAAQPLRGMSELPPLPTGSLSEVTEMLRVQAEMLREQNHYLRTLVMYGDSGPKWKNFLSRWKNDFPDAGPDCKQVLPEVERAYLNCIQEVTDRLRDTDSDELQNDFSLGEFLDKFGTRLNQLSGIMHHLTPLADNVLPVSPPQAQPSQNPPPPQAPPQGPPSAE